MRISKCINCAIDFYNENPSKETFLKIFDVFLIITTNFKNDLHVSSYLAYDISLFVLD
jgi:hypothetical protein